MSNLGQSNSSGAKAFQKSGKTSPVEKVVPLGFLAAGAGSIAVAVATAISPAPHSAIESAAKALDRLGFDKGPLLMFGVLMGGLGYSLLKLGSVGSNGGAADLAAEAAEGNASSLEMQSAILGSLQAEIGGLRHEVAETRREAAESKANEEGNGEGSDPLFRLAASLDQLGAQIDKRIDKARREMLDAVSNVAGQMEVGADQAEKSSAANLSEVEAVRMDIADLRAQVVRATEEASAAARAAIEVKEEFAAAQVVAQSAPSVPAEAAVQEAPEVVVQEAVVSEAPTPVVAHVEEPVSPSLPRELSENAQPEQAAPMPIPMESSNEVSTEGSVEEPRFAGYSHEDEPAQDPAAEGPAAPALGVSMSSLGFTAPEEPAAPLPKPSEDLGLIDEMNKDTARHVDATPPLFPDV